MTVDEPGVMHLDKQRVKAGFGRIAAGYEAANFLAREVGRRMGERLDLLRIRPRTLLDLGSGTGADTRKLRERYPDCVAIELDLSLEMLQCAAAVAPWWQRGLQRLKRDVPVRVCADGERLPFCDRTFDMVWSNLALHWGRLPELLAEVYRVLRPGGVFMFSTLGPDTLKELRESYGEADGYVHVNRFVDLHDIGDLLVGERFADPVMDMEHLTFTYMTLDDLLRELRQASARNANVGRPLGLGGRRSLDRMRAAYERRRRDGRLPATFEVVYGHAWRPETARRAEGGEAVIEFHPRKARLP